MIYGFQMWPAAAWKGAGDAPFTVLSCCVQETV